MWFQRDLKPGRSVPAAKIFDPPLSQKCIFLIIIQFKAFFGKLQPLSTSGAGNSYILRSQENKLIVKNCVKPCTLSLVFEQLFLKINNYKTPL